MDGGQKDVTVELQQRFECLITTELFQKNGNDLNACNNVRDILYNTDIMNSVTKLIVHSPVGKLVLKNNLNLISPRCEQT